MLAERTSSVWVAEMLVMVGECAGRVFGATPFVRRHNNLLVPIGRAMPRVVAFGDPGAVAVDVVVGPFAADLLAGDYELTGAMRVGELTWAHFADVDDLRRLVEMSIHFGAVPERWNTTLKVMPDRRLAASGGIPEPELAPVIDAVRSYADAVMSPESYGTSHTISLPRAVE